MLNRAIEIRGPELDVEVERRRARYHGSGGGERDHVGLGLRLGPHGASADEACADKDDEGGAHPEADHRSDQIQPPSSPTTPARKQANANQHTEINKRVVGLRLARAGGVV